MTLSSGSPYARWKTPNNRDQRHTFTVTDHGLSRDPTSKDEAGLWDDALLTPAGIHNEERHFTVIGDRERHSTRRHLQLPQGAGEVPNQFPQYYWMSQGLGWYVKFWYTGVANGATHSVSQELTSITN